MFVFFRESLYIYSTYIYALECTLQGHELRQGSLVYIYVCVYLFVYVFITQILSFSSPPTGVCGPEIVRGDRPYPKVYREKIVTTVFIDL